MAAGSSGLIRKARCHAAQAAIGRWSWSWFHPWWTRSSVLSVAVGDVIARLPGSSTTGDDQLRLVAARLSGGVRTGSPEPPAAAGRAAGRPEPAAGRRDAELARGRRDPRAVLGHQRLEPP